MRSSTGVSHSKADPSLLNEQQREAVENTEGALLIVAGAGSGKTRVITYRIAHLLAKGVPQARILALTFTNKAAREMRERIERIEGRKLKALTVSTFHAFGCKFLRIHAGKLGLRDNFSIYDEGDKVSLIKRCAREMGLTQVEDFYQVAGVFSSIKCQRKEWTAQTMPLKPLYEEYQRSLGVYNAVDFDDLVALPVKLLRSDEVLRGECKSRYRYVMVDEFQDTSHLQYELLKLIAGENVAVVGDDDQSIYSWRGADFTNITSFEEDFAPVREIKLVQNYRSTGTILEAANGVIRHNTQRKDKQMQNAGGAQGKPIEVFMSADEAQEAATIAEGILGISMEERLGYDAFAVLIRANSQSRAIEEAFLQNNIPYVVSGATSFFDRQEVKDILSYLHVVANTDDDVSLLRIINTPHRGIGKATVAYLGKRAQAQGVSLWQAIEAVLDDEETGLQANAIKALADFAELVQKMKTDLFAAGYLSKKVRALVDEIGYFDHLITDNPSNEKAARAKYQNVLSLCQSIERWERDPGTENAGLYEYLNRVTLISRDDVTAEDAGGKVNLMTVHAAKGLEFPVVFIAGAEEGLMPHMRVLEDGGEKAVEEERRLFYVAVTRAGRRLLISCCQRRKRRGVESECTPSRFLDEIPSHLVKWREESAEVETDAAHEMLQGLLDSLNKRGSRRTPPLGAH